MDEKLRVEGREACAVEGDYPPPESGETAPMGEESRAEDAADGGGVGECAQTVRPGAEEPGEEAVDPAPVPDADGTVNGYVDGEEAERLRAVYPTFDPEKEMQDPVFRALALGEVRPTLRQVYELCHAAEIFGAHAEKASETASETAPGVVSEVDSGAASEAVAAKDSAEDFAADSAAVAAAIAEAEERLLGSIRARGYRPPEHGLSASGGVRMHPAVDKLTRSDRAQLAKRAERGETIRL